MRHRLTITLSVVIALLLTTLVVGYQRVSALTCATAAFTEWDSHGQHGTGACLLYLALAPDGDRVEDEPRPRAAPARPDPGATTEAAATPQATSAAITPSPAPTPPPSPAAPPPPPQPEPTQDPYGTVEEADFGTHTITCVGKAFRYWQEVARFYGEDPSCRAWGVATGFDADGEEGYRDPTFHSSGEAQQYFLLQQEDAAALD